MTTHPFEQSLHELLLGSLAVNLTFLTQTNKIITTVAKQTLGRGVGEIDLLVCEEWSEVSGRGTSGKRKQLTTFTRVHRLILLLFIFLNLFLEW